jgi:hypothetical protein
MKFRYTGEDSIMGSLLTCKLHQILLGSPSEGGWDGRGM